VEGSFRRREEGREEGFAVSPEPESARASTRFESLNVSRVAALSALLSGDAGATAGVASPLEEMGFPAALATGRYSLGVEDPDGLLAEVETDGPGRDRVELWESVQEDPSPYAGVGFLVAVLGSGLERESAAAAAALWRLLSAGGPRVLNSPISFTAMERELGEVDVIEWEGDAWRSNYRRWMAGLPGSERPRQALRFLTERRLRRALRSPDPITVSLAAAAGLPAAPLSFEPAPGGGTGSGKGGAPPAAETVSTMIHGTWGWRGDWWRPSGGFHRFVRGGLRPNLYSLGARFSWSGFYRESHRVQASSDFCEWSDTIAPGGLQSVFGHSYGGEVAARAVLDGAPVEELVLLSSPVTDEVVAAVETGVRVIDVRLPFDPVLALANVGQSLPTRPNVTPVLLKKRSINHSATHEERVWTEQGIAGRAGM
jgi:pimeloyl-ACP methyl ester carboxylesterase